MDASSLEAFLRANDVAGVVVPVTTHTPTVEAAAQVMGVTVEQIVKSVLFLLEPPGGEPQAVLVIANGLGRVDDRRVAAHTGVPRKRIRMAGPEEVLRLTGYPVGGVPPLGHATALRILIDPAVLSQPEVYAGGGALDALLRITPAEIARVTGAEPLAERPAQS